MPIIIIKKKINAKLYHRQKASFRICTHWEGHLRIEERAKAPKLNPEEPHI